MGILEHKIKGTEAEQTITKAITKPWYKKVESWLIIVNIVALIANIIISISI